MCCSQYLEDNCRFYAGAPWTDLTLGPSTQMVLNAAVMRFEKIRLRVPVGASLVW